MMFGDEEPCVVITNPKPMDLWWVAQNQTIFRGRGIGGFSGSINQARGVLYWVLAVRKISVGS